MINNRSVCYAFFIKKYACIFLCTVLLHAETAAQPDTTILTDTFSFTIPEVQISAYEQHQSLKNTPAAVNYIATPQLNRFSNTSIVSAINATPGVRMEERSPGSYRLSIRGSSLRSPFGVRNIKIYYNGIPYTDPGGNAYLNQLGFYNIQSLEILKGPGSSVYGAGTGGVMLVSSMSALWQQGASVNYSSGSYGLHNACGEVRFGTDGFRHTVRYQHLQSDGYRQHSAMRRDVLSWDAQATLNDRNQLSAHFLYGDLYYQTPGALTPEEYRLDPRMARPGNTFISGAVDAKAAIYQKTFLAGFSLNHQFSGRFSNTTSLYGAYTGLLNPNIRNYSRSQEPHFGGRTIFRYRFDLGKSRLDWLLGAEAQQGFSSMRTYRNANGMPDSLQLDDEFDTRQYFAFSQLTWQLQKWIITGGISINRQRLVFTRLSSPPAVSRTRNFDNQLAPRLAVLYKLLPDISAYASVSKGFSPPTTGELSPNGALNSALRAEEGWNYELGLKGYLFAGRLYFETNLFYFGLDNTIVQRRDAAGGDYYTNAGSTGQLGVESQLSYKFHDAQTSAFYGSIWASHTWYRFRYTTFMQLENNYSGNKLPGAAPHTFAGGIDLNTRIGLYSSLTYYFSDAIFMDDANANFADAYHLLGLRLGYKKTLRRRYIIDLLAGADNLLDQGYSLGNDINGFGGRFYNAAPGRNYYAGIGLSFNRP